MSSAGGPLHVESEGDADALPLVLLHGFTQTAACWEPVVPGLADRHRLLLADLPGHGASAEVRADLWGTASLAVEAVASLERRPATWVGYSLGARVALHVALAEPDAIDRLVLISGTAGIDDPSERASRRRTDDLLAARIMEIGVDRFLEEWLALPLFAGIPPERSCRDARRSNTADGLAASLRSCGTGTQEPLWERLAALASTPVLVVSGADDAKFTALGERLVQGIGSAARHVVVDGCGHTPHLEHPRSVIDLLRSW